MAGSAVGLGEFVVELGDGRVNAEAPGKHRKAGKAFRHGVAPLGFGDRQARVVWLRKRAGGVLRLAQVLDALVHLDGEELVVAEAVAVVVAPTTQLEE